MSTDLRSERILKNVRVVEVLDLIGYPWEMVADRTQQIRCPIHDDRSPSARYYHEQQKIHCFTCGKSWDVIGLISAKRSLSRESAMDYLDEEFPTSASASTLTQRIKAQLREPLGPDYGILFDDTERRLIARRRELGLEVYSKRLLALDLTRHKLAEGTLTGEAVPDILRRVLA